MKTEVVSITTRKTLSVIADDLRAVSSRLRADLSSPDMSPFGNVGIRPADMSIALSGSHSVLGGPRKWGVQVLVTDGGGSRVVELIAVGDDLSNKLMQGSFGKPFFDLQASMKRVKKIVEAIQGS